MSDRPTITVELTATQLANLMIGHSGISDFERMASSTIDVRIVVVDES